jgi:hypothetical protein
MNKKYIVRLSADEREQLTQMVSTGKAAAYKIKHAHILLKADADGPNWPDAKIADAFSCVAQTVFNVRQRWVTQGLEAALGRKHRAKPPCAPLLDGEGQARLVQIACSEPPEGCARWTLQLLADELVALDIVDSISPPTVMRALKKTNCNPIGASTGSSHPTAMPRL